MAATGGAVKGGFFFRANESGASRVGGAHLPSTQQCIIAPGTDVSLLPQIVTPHPSLALSRE